MEILTCKYLKIRKLLICEVVLFILIQVDFYFNLPHRTLTVVVAGIICLCIVTNKTLFIHIFILILELTKVGLIRTTIWCGLDIVRTTA